jgi:hypothetical protein
MLYFTFFFFELILLFLLSQKLTQILSLFFYRISHSKRFTVNAIAVLFFPGTIIHEFSHALFARLLGVRVGTMEFVPKAEDEHVKLGSVQVAHTDPVRRFLIGAAPFFLGIVIILGLLFYAVQNRLFDNTLPVILIGYAVFEISNTMFSSRKDMEGALELFAVIMLLIIIFYLLGIRLPSFSPDTFLAKPPVREVFKRGSLFLLVPLTVDTVIILLFRPRHKNS